MSENLHFGSFPLLAAGLVLLATLTAAAPARAALGGNAASIQNDQVHMQASLRTISAASYTVQEMQTHAGAVVREYVSSSGTVFAITWHSPWPPDMRQLLGSYFDPYTAAAKSQSASSRMGRRPLVVAQPGFVVQIAGHARAFVGRAYIPDMLPEGLRVEDIR
jgi:hypothetical protein